MSNSQSFQLSSLPDELILSCVARMSRSDYAALSRVSKRYHSLVISSELYKTRSLMGLTKKCFYVCIDTLDAESNSNPQWYNLSLEKTLDAKSRMITIPNSYHLDKSSAVALDWGIYVIGGLVKGEPTSDIWLLDCRTNTWSKIPSMVVARYSAAVGVVNGKIYVFGGCKDLGLSNWGEVFDPKTQSWDSLPPFPQEIPTLPSEFQLFDHSLVIEEKVYAVENRWETEKSHIVYYSPNEGKWGRRNHDSSRYINSDCVMMNTLLYCCDPLGNLFWCKPDEFIWKEVKGLEYLRTCIPQYPQNISWDVAHVKVFIPKPPFGKLRDCGETIMVFWSVVERNVQSSKIWCAEISLRDAKREMRFVARLSGWIQLHIIIIILKDSGFYILVLSIFKLSHNLVFFLLSNWLFSCTLVL